MRVLRLACVSSFKQLTLNVTKSSLHAFNMQTIEVYRYLLALHPKLDGTIVHLPNTAMIQLQ